METITSIYNALCERDEDKATVSEVRKVMYRYIVPTLVIITLASIKF